MKKILIGIAVALMILVILGFVFQQSIFFYFMSAQIAPEQDFGQMAIPSPPDYSDDQYWAGLPNKQDPSDQMPEGVVREDTGVAVFYVHPTTYFGKTWNQPLDHADANWIVDERNLRHQASVFNGCCDVYAPRFRQATFFSFMDRGDNSKKALALAYADVVAAFESFLSRINPDQPFIVAGHSQGTRHVAQLVREKVTSTSLQDRLVAAYLVGFSVTYPELASLPACDSPTQTNCAIGWNSMDDENGGAFGGVGAEEKLLCTNPLNWRDGGGYAANELNMGGIGFPSQALAEEGEDYEAMHVETGVAGAQCVDDGSLAIMELRSEAFPHRMFGTSMHIYDYSLFHMNIRENLATRIAAFAN